jgi:hypothetical protein
MVVDERDSVDRPRLDDGAVEDLAQVVRRASLTGL